MKSPKINVQSRVDPRILASLAKYFAKNGIFNGTRSGTITKSLELLYYSLLNQELLKPVETAEEANKIMIAFGMGDLSDNVKNLASMVKIDEEVANSEKVSAEVQEMLEVLSQTKGE